MKIEFNKNQISKVETDCEIIFVVDKNFNHKFIYNSDKDELNRLKFEAKSEQSRVGLFRRSRYLDHCPLAQGELWL